MFDPSLLDNIILDSEESDNSDRSEPLSEPDYTGNIDYRIRQLSYSSLLTLHKCPRKFQLYKLGTNARTPDSVKQSVTFAFGHIVGDGVQLALQGKSLNEIIWHSFLQWPVDLFDEDEKAKKSFWSGIIAIQRFQSIVQDGVLGEYELVYYQDRPACELSFVINFPDSFRYRGFVDAVLRHKETGEVLVLECKTTGSKTLNPAMYKNSAQAIGYSIVLDAIFPELSSYKVLYLPYQTHSGEFTPIPFDKTYLQRALWIRELLLDIETIKAYEDANVYPMHGESCFDFYRECEYINSCTLSTESLTRPVREIDRDRTEYQVTLSLADLIETQMSKVSS